MLLHRFLLQVVRALIQSEALLVITATA